MKNSPTKLGLFPKERFKQKPNRDSTFVLKTETMALPGSANWDGLFALQLDYLPAQPSEGQGQTIPLPVVTNTTDATTRTVTWRATPGGAPATTEVYIDVETGIVQFNAADAGDTFQIQYYAKANLISAEDFNRCWAAGPEYLIGDDSYCDYDNLASAMAAAPSGVLSTYKLRKNLTVAAAINISKPSRVMLENYTLTQSGGATHAFNITEDCIIEGGNFSGWAGGSDITIYASADKRVRLLNNDFTGNTQAENISSVCTKYILMGNFPNSVNLGSVVPTNQIVIGDGVTSNTFDEIEFPAGSFTDLGTGKAKINNSAPYLSKNYTSNGSITAYRPVFVDSSDPTKALHKSTVTINDRDYFLGIPAASVSTGLSVQIATTGILTGLSGLTPGAFCWVDAAGLLTQTPANGLILIGKALSSSAINIGETPVVDFDKLYLEGPGRLLSPVTSHIARVYKKIYEFSVGDSALPGCTINTSGGSIVSNDRIVPGSTPADYAEFSVQPSSAIPSSALTDFNLILRTLCRSFSTAPTLTNDCLFEINVGVVSGVSVPYVRSSYNAGNKNYFVWEPGAIGTWHDSGITPSVGGNCDCVEIIIKDNTISYVINGTFISTYTFPLSGAEALGHKPRVTRPVSTRNTLVVGTGPHWQVAAIELIIMFPNKR